MRVMSDKTWERHANPWSGFTRIITYPLVYVPVWFFQELFQDPVNNWYPVLGILLVMLWFWLNPRIFPKPRNFNHWMSKGVLGEKLWTENRKYTDLDYLLLFGVGTLFFIIGIYTACMKMFWATMFFASTAFLLKLWYVDRMVFFYEANKKKLDR